MTVHSRFRVGRHPLVTRELIWSETLTLDSAEILSSIIPARTYALGQVESANSGTSIALESYGFADSNQDHSGQFHGYYSEKRGNNAFRQKYWLQLLNRGLQRNKPGQLSELSNIQF